jgi:hypothetical protein
MPLDQVVALVQDVPGVLGVDAHGGDNFNTNR